MATPVDRKESIERLRALPQVQRWREGNYEPGAWFTSKPAEEGGIWGSWGHRFQPNRRGVSFVELNRADRHPIPEEGLGMLVDREAGAEPQSPRYASLSASCTRWSSYPAIRCPTTWPAWIRRSPRCGCSCPRSAPTKRAIW